MKWLLAFALALAAVAAAAQPNLQLGVQVNDVAASSSALYVALGNGTLISLGNGTRGWVVNVAALGYGVPKIVRVALPYGLLVLTDGAWLGLIALEGMSREWIRLEGVDANAIVRGDVDLQYSSGTAVVYVGKAALLVKVPGLQLLTDVENMKNKFIECAVSPDGKYALAVGYDTYCFVCIQNDEKTVVVWDVESGKRLRGTVYNLRDVAIVQGSRWLALAIWSQLKVYSIGNGTLLGSLVASYNYSHPINSWRSSGFSPHGAYFHYTYGNGDLLRIHAVSIETWKQSDYSLPFPPGKFIVSSINDAGDIAVLSLCRSTNVLYLAFISGKTGQLHLATLPMDYISPIKLRMLEGHAAAIVSSEILFAPPLLLRPSAAPSERTPSLYAVSFEVVDDRGAPVAGALVCVNFTCKTTTLEGRTTLLLQEGNYTVSATGPSILPFKGTISVRGNQSLSLTVSKLVSLTVRGVLDNGTTPSCTIIVSRNSTVVKKLDTANCTAALKLVRGAYEVSVEVSGTRVARVIDLRENTEVLVVARAPIVPPAKYSLFVEARDEEGAPLPAANITILDQEGRLVHSSKGVCNVTVPPARYTIVVTADNYIAWTLSLEVKGPTAIYPRLTLVRVERGIPAYVLFLATAAIALAALEGWRSRRTLMALLSSVSLSSRALGGQLKSSVKKARERVERLLRLAVRRGDRGPQQ